jgi:predicted phosphodiesterase
MNIKIIEGPILVFGGPYSNLQATLALKLEAENLGIAASNIICTGDVVAYCGDPEPTVSLIRDWGIHVVMGNCEESLAEDADDCGCGFDEGTACSLLSNNWYQYAKAKLSVDSKQWMNTLPRSIEFNSSGCNFQCIHGSVTHINQFIFASTDQQLKADEIALTNADIILAGHCGLPFGQQIADKAWLNAGVIGMPANEGKETVWYMLVSPIDGSIKASWHRLQYDVDSAQRAMRGVGLSTQYGNALKTGLWPSLDVLPAQEQSLSGKNLDLTPLTLKIAKSS